MHAGVTTYLRGMHAYHGVTTSSNSNTCAGDTTEGANKSEANYHSEGTSHKNS